MIGDRWFGTVPPKWKEVPLFAVAAERRDSNAGMRETNLLSLSYGRIIPKDIDASDGLLPASFETYQIVQRDDIVLRLTDLQNDQRSLRSGLVFERGIITSAYLALAPRGVASRFLAYQLRAIDQMKVFYAMGGGLRQSIGFAELKRLQILVPPLAEQHAIADYLDRETARIDAFIAENEKLIALLAERRAMVVRAATSGRTDEKAKLVDSGLDGVGSIPAGWRVMRLSWLFRSTGSGTTPPSEQMLDGDEADVWWVTTGELRERTIEATNRGVSTDTLASTSALKIHPAGSLLIAMYGATIGRMGVLGVPAASNQAVCALSGPVGCSVDFVVYAMLAARERLLLAAVGGGQPNINQETVRAFRIPVPDLAEQRQIVRYLRSRVGEIDRATETAARGIQLARERRAALISAAVTGKIDVGMAV